MFLLTDTCFWSHAYELFECKIFDINGRLIRKYSQIRSHPGLNEVTWNGLNEQGKAVGSGVYFYRISGSRFTQTKKMVLIR